MNLIPTKLLFFLQNYNLFIISTPMSMQAANSPGSKTVFIERILSFPINHQLIFEKIYLTSLRIYNTTYLYILNYVCMCVCMYNRRIHTCCSHVKAHPTVKVTTCFLSIIFILLKIAYCFQIQNDYVIFNQRSLPLYADLIDFPSNETWSVIFFVIVKLIKMCTVVMVIHFLSSQSFTIRIIF